MPSDSWIKAGQVPVLMSYLCFTRVISSLVPMIGLGDFSGKSSDGQRKEKVEEANAFQLEELSRALCAPAAQKTERRDNRLSSDQLCDLELHISDIHKALGLKAAAVLSEGERRLLPFSQQQRTA